MDPLDILNHLLNFVAPAAALALLLVLTGGWIGPKGRPALSAGRRFAILFAVGVALSVYRERLLALPERMKSREGVFQVLNWR